MCELVSFSCYYYSIFLAFECEEGSSEGEKHAHVLFHKYKTPLIKNQKEACTQIALRFQLFNYTRNYLLFTYFVSFIECVRCADADRQIICSGLLLSWLLHFCFLYKTFYRSCNFFPSINNQICLFWWF